MTSDTLVSIFFRQAESLDDAPFLRVKTEGQYRDVSWSTVAERVRAIAAGLIRHGVKPGDRVGMLSENRREWIEADLAIMSTGAITVALHSPLTSAQVREQFADAEPRIVLVSTAEQRDKVLEARPQLPSIERIYAFESSAAGVGGTE